MIARLIAIEGSMMIITIATIRARDNKKKKRSLFAGAACRIAIAAAAAFVDSPTAAIRGLRVPRDFRRAKSSSSRRQTDNDPRAKRPCEKCVLWRCVRPEFGVGLFFFYYFNRSRETPEKYSRKTFAAKIIGSTSLQLDSNDPTKYNEQGEMTAVKNYFF